MTKTQTTLDEVLSDCAYLAQRTDNITLWHDIQRIRSEGRPELTGQKLEGAATVKPVTSIPSKGCDGPSDTQTTTRRRPKFLWKPTESIDFYRGKIAECERLVVQIENSLAELPKRLRGETSDAKHQRGLIVAARKHVYDAMLNTCEIHIREAKKLIKWIETGVQPA